MLIAELLQQAGYSDHCLPAREITGITSNSENVQKGNLFVAIRGLHHDGHLFVHRAIEKGAVAVVAERALECANVLVVPDTREALARLLDAWYGHPAKKLRLIGITGTNGKTSVSYMVWSLLRQAGYSCGLIGTVECRLNDQVLSSPNPSILANMTTPDPAELYRLLGDMRDGGAEYVIMEVSSHALAFSKVAPLIYERAIFTNLTPDHLDLHGDMESYFMEKKKLFASCRGAVVSCLGSYGERLANELEAPLWRLDDACLNSVQQQGCDGVSFSLKTENGQRERFYLPIPGEFSVENGALAALTAMSLGLQTEQIQAGLRQFTGVKGRMERVDEGDVDFSVFIDYAHTPDALEKLLYSARSFCPRDGRVVVVFGCGGDRDRGKRAEMGRVASKLADFLILTADNSRSERTEDILRDILRGTNKEKPYKVIPDRRAAISYAIESAKKNDVILLAGKGHEEYEIIGNRRLPFAERDIVRECILQRRRKHEN